MRFENVNYKGCREKPVGHCGSRVRRGGTEPVPQFLRSMNQFLRSMKQQQFVST